jgi:hypothetical protein
MLSRTLRRFRFLLLIAPALGVLSAVATGCGGRTDDFIQADGTGNPDGTSTTGYGAYGAYGYGYGGYGP